LQIGSILDIGSGTGRAIRYIKKLRPELRIVGIEPVKELREVGYSHGLSEEDLVDGMQPSYSSAHRNSIWLRIWGSTPHKRPELAVSEMLRVAGKAIFISDSNNFGHGSNASRSIKQMINFLGLWKIADLIKTKGRGFTISEGDGLAYSYSVFNNYKQIRTQCSSIHLLNTRDGFINFYKTASHVALLGIKK